MTTAELQEMENGRNLLLAVAGVTLVPLRLVVGMAILLLYYLICEVCTLFSTPKEEQKGRLWSPPRVTVKCGRFLAPAPALLLTLGFYWISEAYRSSLQDSPADQVHILLLCQFVNFMEVTRLPVCYPSKEEKDDPKLYASNVRKLLANEVIYVTDSKRPPLCSPLFMFLSEVSGVMRNCVMVCYYSDRPLSDALILVSGNPWLKMLHASTNEGSSSISVSAFEDSGIIYK